MLKPRLIMAFGALILSTACGTTPAKPDPTPGVDPVEPAEATSTTKPALTHSDVLGALCAPEDIDGQTCAVCPPGFSDPDLTGPLQIVASQAGSFTAAGADEILVTFEGCTGAPTFTESALMTRGPGGLEVIARSTILHAVTCQYPKDASGRDLVVCMDIDGAQGFNYTDLSLFGVDSEMTSTNLFQLLSNTAACPASGEEYSTDEGTKLTLSDLDGDGLDDLTVAYTSSHGLVPNDHADYCEAEMANFTFPAPQALTKTFLQRDGTFVPQ